MEKIENNESKKNTVVTPKTIDIFSGFAVSLKRIHLRLIAEGYIIKEGEITKYEKLLAIEKDNIPPKKSTCSMYK